MLSIKIDHKYSRSWYPREIFKNKLYLNWQLWDKGTFSLCYDKAYTWVRWLTHHWHDIPLNMIVTKWPKSEEHLKYSRIKKTFQWIFSIVNDVSVLAFSVFGVRKFLVVGVALYSIGYLALSLASINYMLVTSHLFPNVTMYIFLVLSYVNIFQIKNTDNTQLHIIWCDKQHQNGHTLMPLQSWFCELCENVTYNSYV